jgi:hypothetical protein
MAFSKNSLTVIIPSIGRAGVQDLIDAISADGVSSGNPVKIIVALNGGVLNLERIENQVSVLVLSKEKIGFSAAVNRVIAMVDTEFVSIIADDDSWFSGKICNDLALLKTNDVILPSVNFSDNLGSTLRPRIRYQGDQRISDFLFSDFSYSRSKRYISISGSTMRQEILHTHHFREDLLIREDIEWLDRVYDSRARIIQSDQVTVGIHVDLKRASNRESRDSLFAWVGSLQDMAGHKASCNFLSGAAIKPFVVTNDREMISLVTTVARSSLTKPYFALYLWRRFFWLLISFIL